MSSTYSSLHTHIVFSTELRTPLIGPEMQPRLHAFIAGSVKTLEAVPLAVGGVADHVHILASLRTDKNVADLVREVKKAATHWAKDIEPAFGWQNGYGAFSVGYRDLPMIKNYIARQAEHHKKLSSRDELLAMLEEFGVEYDSKYFI